MLVEAVVNNSLPKSLHFVSRKVKQRNKKKKKGRQKGGERRSILNQKADSLILFSKSEGV